MTYILFFPEKIARNPIGTVISYSLMHNIQFRGINAVKICKHTLDILLYYGILVEAQNLLGDSFMLHFLIICFQIKFMVLMNFFTSKYFSHLHLKIAILESVYYY